MRPNFEIQKVEVHKRPLFIFVANYHLINKITLYNLMDKRVKQTRHDIGQWIINYKTK
jgi:hypothetical protein